MGLPEADGMEDAGKTRKSAIRKQASTQGGCMEFFSLREPVSAWSHLAGLLLAVVGTLWLWRRSRGGRFDKRLSLLIFGLSLAFCYGASSLYHGARVSDERLALLDRIDHVGIFLLIAGSYTPLAWNLLAGRWRWGTLSIVWMIAATASVMLVVGGVFPPILNTAVYLAMGWGSIACYAEMARVVTHRLLWPLLGGGVFYSIGALLNILDWPALWPGVFNAHDLFHFFVLAGSMSHYRLILRVVVPFKPLA
jgi:hemolysin III